MNSLMSRRPVKELIPLSFFGGSWDKDLDDVFESLMESTGLEKYNWTPRVESYRKNGTYVVKADLPGVAAKDIQVTLENGCLTIKGERKVDKEVKEKKVERREVFYGSFERCIPVPEGLKTEGVKAKYRDGVLEVTVPGAVFFLLLEKPANSPTSFQIIQILIKLLPTFCDPLSW